MKNTKRWAGALALGLALSVTPAAEAHEPGDLQITMHIQCDSRDAATDEHEPIITWWSGGYGEFEFDVYLTVEYPIGKVIGSINPYGLPSEGMHDMWLSGPPVPTGGEYKVNLYADDTLYLTATSDCSAEPPVFVDPAPRRAPKKVHVDRVRAGWRPKFI